ncbi:MAG: hypothetical protein KDE27_01075 [Planctomycetes bacterium]|nr:hypothetical protein [Planctomycetota bacterium]
MSRFSDKRLWELLPAFHRLRDADGGALEALVRVLATQARRIESDIDELLDNLFIETCEEWVVPYVGDLLGVRNLHEFASEAKFSQRARVANTIAYRRRKGTAPMLEQLALDTTGWRSRAIEFFLRLDTTQHLNHLRLDHHRTLDLRDTGRLELIGSAFDPATYTVDVRPIAEGAARPNIPNVGLFLWRLTSYPIERSEARAVAEPGDGRYRFDPLGLDAPLFNRPQTETEITHLATEINVPGPLRRRPLYDELEARRQTLAENEVLGEDRSIAFAYFDDPEDDDSQAVLRVWVDEQLNGREFVAIESDEIMICDLSGWDVPGWTAPSGTKTYTVTLPDGATVDLDRTISAFVDPVLGRLAFPAGSTPGIAHVSCSYGFPGDLAAGSYERVTGTGNAVSTAAGWAVAVGRDATIASLGLAPGANAFTTLDEAIEAWNTQTAETTGCIALLDNSVQELSSSTPITAIVGEGRRLTIVAADAGFDGSEVFITRTERRGLIRGELRIQGTAPNASSSPGQFALDGVVCESRILVEPGNLGTLAIASCTLVEGIEVDTTTDDLANESLAIELERTVTAPIIASSLVRRISARDCVIHEHSLLAGSGVGSGVSIAADANADEAGPPTELERTTVLGRTFVQTLSASETIFYAAATAERLQEGCVRFSFVPVLRLGVTSRVPRRYRCQPDLALDARATELGVDRAALSAAEAALVIARIVPQFTSTRFGDPGFVQLALACVTEIATGAEDGSEMGAWSFLKNPQRVANLTASLDEYLRVGLDSGLVYAT